MEIDKVIKIVTFVGFVFGMSWGGIHALDTRYTPLSNYEQHLEAEQSRYVLELKKSIRDIQAKLRADPGNPYLLADLEDTIATLCEIRPEDKLCH